MLVENNEFVEIAKKAENNKFSDELKTYIENNENIQEVLSTMSVDGKSIYGWMLASEIEYKTQHKEINVQKIMLTR